MWNRVVPQPSGCSRCRAQQAPASAGRSPAPASQDRRGRRPPPCRRTRRAGSSPRPWSSRRRSEQRRSRRPRRPPATPARGSSGGSCVLALIVSRWLSRRWPATRSRESPQCGSKFFMMKPDETTCNWPHPKGQRFPRSCDFTAHMCTGLILSNYKLFVNPLFKLISIEHVIIGSKTQWKTM